jgi:hypothetical protein
VENESDRCFSQRKSCIFADAQSNMQVEGAPIEALSDDGM